jgi:hypothetical protein
MATEEALRREGGGAGATQFLVWQASKNLTASHIETPFEIHFEEGLCPRHRPFGNRLRLHQAPLIESVLFDLHDESRTADTELLCEL